MIPKSSQRGGGQQLATHLLNAFSNENVEIAGVRGAIAQDLHGAFAEWRAMADGTKCRKYLFSLSINPYQKENGPLTREQYMDFIARTEQEFGLTDQPRAVVFHVKHGREHCHVVWSRIITDDMKAVQISYDRNRLREIAREFAHDYGLTLPEGMREDKGNDRFFNQDKFTDWFEKAAEERTGLTKQDHIEAVTAIWDGSDSAKAFLAGLDQAGYVLTRGEKEVKRGVKTSYVLVDKEGTPFNLAKLIHYKNVDQGHLCSFLEHEFPELKAQLESAGSVIEILKTAAAAKEAHMRDDFLKEANQLNQKLEKLHSERRAVFDEKYQAMQQRHKKESAALSEIQKVSGALIRRSRIGKQPSGVAAVLYRVTGLRAAKRFMAFRKIQTLRRSHTDERRTLQQRHNAEIKDYQRQDRALGLVERKERSALDAEMRKLARMAARDGRTSSGRSASPEKKPHQLKHTKPRTTKPRDPGRGGKDK